MSGEKQLRRGCKRMIDEIIRETAMTASLTGHKKIPERILDVMRRTPRHYFVPEEMAGSAYDNRALAIGLGQTISQPFIVALMTTLLAPEADHTVLEVGTGSGYQAAVLSQLVKQVYSVEIVPELAGRAGNTLADHGYDNVCVIHDDGGAGLHAHAPYDGIIVTAAAPAVPKTLIDQLKPGGRLVIPVKADYFSQALMLITKDEQGLVHERNVLAVVFVPLTGDGWKR